MDRRTQGLGPIRNLSECRLCGDDDSADGRPSLADEKAALRRIERLSVRSLPADGPAGQYTGLRGARDARQGLAVGGNGLVRRLDSRGGCRPDERGGHPGLGAGALRDDSPRRGSRVRGGRRDVPLPCTPRGDVSPGEGPGGRLGGSRDGGERKARGRHPAGLRGLGPGRQKTPAADAAEYRRADQRIDP